MSGAVAAHAAFNGSGTQGLAVTNKVHDDEGDVMSVFWNKNDTTRQLLYGNSVLEIPTSGGGSANFDSSQIFTVNNDIDCLGDMFAEVVVTNTTNGALGTQGYGDAGSIDTTNCTQPQGNLTSCSVSNFGLASIIDRVEFQVGTQIWQTLESTDTIACLNAELSEGAFERFALQANGFTNSLNNVTGTLNSSIFLGSDIAAAFATDVPAGTSNATADIVAQYTSAICYVPLPSLSKTLAPLLAKYTDQTEDGYPMAAAPHQSVKIKLTYAKQSDTLTGVTGIDSTGNTTQVTLFDTATIKVKLFAQHMIMCNEERMQIKSMPQGLPKRLKMTQNASQTKTLAVAGTTVQMDLDHFSLYTSHLIISLDLDSDSSAVQGLVSAELKLNSSSFSGVVSGAFMQGPAAESLGLYNNCFVPGGANSSMGIGMCIFPLASNAYGGSSVPLNRFDNIRLTLIFAGSTAIPSAKINVTCCGETTALFKGGAASLAMY